MADLHFFIILGVIFIVIALLVTKIVRDRKIAAKGSIDIQLEKPASKLGDTIHGEVLIKPLQDIDVMSVELTLECILIVGSASNDGNGSQRRKTIYQDTVTLRERFSLRANQLTTVPLSIRMPQPTLLRREDKKLKKHNTRDNQTAISWSLTARLRCPGVDLSDWKNLVVPWTRAQRDLAA